MSPGHDTPNAALSNDRNKAFMFIILMGIVSLFGDITYEGARSITGPFLAVLGASAAAVGFVSGFGEFIGYALRLAAGYFADRSENYWLFTIVGYVLILSVPLLAFAGHWQTAAMMIFLERMGKAIRSPARDTLLSHATKQVGRGRGFGLHEALDQIGAVIGPLVFSVVFVLQGSFRDGLKLLLIPAALTLAVLIAAAIRYPATAAFEPVRKQDNIAVPAGFGKVFWLYSLFVFLSVAGFMSFQLISFHFKTHDVMPDRVIPLYYAVAMGVDGLAALVIGRLYDRIGLSTLALIPALTIALPFAAFSRHYALAFGSAVLWGAVMGTHETIMRAAVADLTERARRGFAYGIFNTVYGAAFLFGSTLMGFLYELSPAYLVAFAAIAEMASIPAFLAARRSAAAARTP